MFRKFFTLILCLMMTFSSVALAEIPDVSKLDQNEQLLLLDELFITLDNSAITAAFAECISAFSDDELAMLSNLILAEIESRDLPTLQKGSKGEEVRRLQERLIELGYLSGNADGSFGNKTAEAVKAFQDTVALEQTGIADPETQKALYSENAPEVPTEVYQETTSSSAGSGGIRPEIKDALDSYEVFFTEYCEFIKKYEEADQPITMLMDYLSFMQSYADAMSKLEAMEEDLNDAELTYYMQVMGRITQKLLEVAY